MILFASIYIYNFKLIIMPMNEQKDIDSQRILA